MKNKNLLLSAFTLFALLTVSITIFATFITKNENDSQVATYGFYQQSPSADVNVVVDVNVNKGSVNTTFKRANVDNKEIVIEKDNYITWSNDLDSPIRGIGSFSLKTNSEDYNDAQSDLRVYVYLSFNHLSLEDVLDGKYQDLKVRGLNRSIDTGWNDSTKTIYYTLNELNYRYFLAVICATDDVRIQKASISTPCQDEPTREDENIGVYSSYSAEELATLPTGFPFIGNGSYESYYDSMWTTFDTLENTEIINSFINNLLLQDYEYAGYLEMATADIYQKEITENSYYTVAFLYISTYDDIIVERIVYFADPQPWMGPYNVWPQEKILSYFADESFKQTIASPELPDNELTYSIMEEPGLSTNIGVIVGNLSKDESVLQDYVDAVIANVNHYKNSGSYIQISDTFIDKEEEDDPYCYIGAEFVTNDLRHSVMIVFQCEKVYNSYISFSFTERSSMSLNEFNDSITAESVYPAIVAENAAFAIESTYTSGDGSNAHTNYYINNITDDEIDDYILALSNSGFSTTGSGSDNYAIYAHKTVVNKAYRFTLTRRGNTSVYLAYLDWYQQQ